MLRGNEDDALEDFKVQYFYINIQCIYYLSINHFTIEYFITCRSDGWLVKLYV